VNGGGALAIAGRSPAATTDGAAIANADRPSRAAASQIEFAGVWFAYDGDAYVLRDCSFAVAAGEHVALVGPTGEGKSTCARLLVRAYDAPRGRVPVAGAAVRGGDWVRLRRRAGPGFQDPGLSTGTATATVAPGPARP